MTFRDLVLRVQLKDRLIEIGANGHGNEEMPKDIVRDMISGRTLMIVTKGPDLCPDCGKMMARVYIYPKTEKPLSELFPGS